MKEFLVRPHAKTLIQNAARNWRVVIFTEMTQAKADPLIDQLDPGKYVHSRFYRDSCFEASGIWIKDLRKLENKDFFQKVVFVDDEEANFILYKKNGIAISPWKYGDNHDKEL